MKIRSWRADNGGFIESRTLTDLDFEVRPPPPLENPIMADFNLGLFVTNQARDIITSNSTQPVLTQVNNSYGIQAIECEEMTYGLPLRAQILIYINGISFLTIGQHMNWITQEYNFHQTSL